MPISPIKTRQLPWLWIVAAVVIFVGGWTYTLVGATTAPVQDFHLLTGGHGLAFDQQPLLPVDEQPISRVINE